MEGLFEEMKNIRDEFPQIMSNARHVSVAMDIPAEFTAIRQTRYEYNEFPKTKFERRMYAWFEMHTQVQHQVDCYISSISVRCTRSLFYGTIHVCYRQEWCFHQVILTQVHSEGSQMVKRDRNK